MVFRGFVSGVSPVGACAILTCSASRLCAAWGFGLAVVGSVCGERVAGPGEGGGWVSLRAGILLSRRCLLESPPHSLPVYWCLPGYVPPDAEL